MERLKRRQDFVAAAKAMSQAMPTVVVQLRTRADSQGAPSACKGPRTGFTCTKKLGNAVVRNHIKRRLREAVRLSLPDIVRPGCDYVFIGRVKTGIRPFAALQGDIVSAVQRLHEKTPPASPPEAVGQKSVEEDHAAR